MSNKTALTQLNRLLKKKFVLLVTGVAFGWGQQAAHGQDQANFGVETVGSNSQIETESEGASALMRGPVHEAFAEQFSANVSPSEVINREPPAAIDELPPAFKPAGVNIEWISGYWSWDIESDDYVWVTGIWRNVPPNQQWIPGYWSAINDGWQWISGFWTAADTAELVYIPTPPDAIDNGPSSPPPGADYFWIPGSWQYNQNQFVWQAGYWAHAQDDWVWVPNRYISTPSGCLYRDGFWDFEVQSRGTVFCPMTFNTGYSQQFRPRYVVEVGPYWMANLFVTPGFNHYCFGNYYGYQGKRTIYPWVTSYQHSRQYDPLFSYYGYQSRHTNLIQQIAKVERRLFNDPNLRTKASVSAQLQAASSLPSQQAHWALRAIPINVLASSNNLDFDTPFQFTAVEQRLVREGQTRVNAVRQLAQQRRDLELANSPEDKQRALPRSSTDPANASSAAGKIASPGNVKRLSIRAKSGDDEKGRLGPVNPNSPLNPPKNVKSVNNENSPKRVAEPALRNEKKPDLKDSKNSSGNSNAAREGDAKRGTRNAFEHLNQDVQENKSGDDARALREMSRSKTHSAGGTADVKGAEKQNVTGTNNAKSGSGAASSATQKSPSQPRPEPKSVGPAEKGQPKNSKQNQPSNNKNSQPAKPKRGNDKK